MIDVASLTSLLAVQVGNDAGRSRRIGRRRWNAAVRAARGRAELGLLIALPVILLVVGATYVMTSRPGIGVEGRERRAGPHGHRRVPRRARLPDARPVIDPAEIEPFLFETDEIVVSTSRRAGTPCAARATLVASEAWGWLIDRDPELEHMPEAGLVHRLDRGTWAA